MSRFKVSVIALTVIVVALVTIGACAQHASATPGAHRASRLASRASAPAIGRANLAGTAVDSEWAVAAHVNW
jgi:hypothetical protein